MFLGGSNGAGDATPDEPTPSGPEPSLHDRILDAEAAVRQARATYWKLLAEAAEHAGPSVSQHRNEALWLADSLRIPKGTAGSHCHRGRLLYHHLPALGDAFDHGVINEEHVGLFHRLWRRPELRAHLTADLDGLIGFARNDWATCKELFDAWETIVDPIDPNEYAERAHADRGLATTEPVSQQVLIQILSTTAAWAQIQPALEAKTAELFEADWANARARLGDDATMADLGRSDSQRRHDAFVIIMRHGIGADPTLANVTGNAVMDDQTFQEEAERRDAIANGQEPVRRPLAPGEAIERARTRRCETITGMALSPADAFDYTIAGHVRLYRMNTTTGEFSQSPRTRLFKGALRTGILIRDRHCQGPGCDTHARHCDIDHTTRYEDGGATTPTNGQPLCGPCHRHKSRLEMLGLWPPAP